MNKTIRLKDKDFALYIPEQDIVNAITRMADNIGHDIAGKNPLFVGILNGAYMFVAELMSKLSPDYELTFAAYSSYHGTKPDEIIQETLPVRGEIRNRPVILLEDIIDTGLTMQHITQKLYHAGADDVRIATMLFKPNALKCNLTPDYVGMEVDNDFLVGFGLDYDGLGRSSRDIYKIIQNNQPQN